MCSVCFHNPMKARPCKGVYDQHPVHTRPDDQLSQSMIPPLSMIAHAVLTSLLVMCCAVDSVESDPMCILFTGWFKPHSYACIQIEQVAAEYDLSP